MLTVGLTGGIGSGKSTVAAVLSELGAVVIDADQVAREVVEPGTPTLTAIADRFGVHLIQPDGTLDRAGLAALAFPDPTALADLNAITGPAITARVAEQRARVDPGDISVFDMPLLVERRLWPHEHLTIVVGADEAVRIERLVARRGLSEEDARHRVAAQATDDQRRAAADVWIDNNGDRSATEEQVRRLWADRLTPFNDNLVNHTRSKRPEVNAVVDADPTWPAQAARLVARIEDALAEMSVSIDHIGSTSVPGLIAKDVIDLQIGVDRLADADAPEFVAALEQRGFLLVVGNVHDTPHPPRDDPRDWQKRFYSSTDPGRIANVHVREIGSPGWEFALMFRDWLRANPVDRESYAAEKRRVLAAVASTTEYVDAKEPWFSTAYPRVVDWARGTRWVPGGVPGLPSDVSEPADVSRGGRAQPEVMRGEYKVPGGKLVAVDVTVERGRLARVSVSGDFFLEPDEALEDINAALTGMPVDASADQLAHAVSGALDDSVAMIGFTPESVGVAVRRALGHATGWQDHIFDVIPAVTMHPAMHVALDEVISREVAAGERPPTLRFWDWDSPLVVIGSFQSVRNEIDPEGAARHKIDVVRRISGGGAMFMEPGNCITYSLVVPSSLVEGLSFERSYAFLDEWVIGALAEVGVNAHYIPLNDIASDKGKIGGAAQKRFAAGAVLHHVTMAYDIDADKMLDVLRIGREKMSDKGTKSANKRVDPMRSQTGRSRDEILRLFADSFRRRYATHDSTYTEAELAEAEGLVASKFSTPEWTNRVP